MKREIFGVDHTKTSLYDMTPDNFQLDPTKRVLLEYKKGQYQMRLEQMDIEDNPLSQIAFENCHTVYQYEIVSRLLEDKSLSKTEMRRFLKSQSSAPGIPIQFFSDEFEKAWAIIKSYNIDGGKNVKQFGTGL